MLIEKNKIKNDIKPVSELEVYCVLEGLNPVNELRVAKYERNQQKKINIKSFIVRLFDRWFGN